MERSSAWDDWRGSVLGLLCMLAVVAPAQLVSANEPVHGRERMRLDSLRSSEADFRGALRAQRRGNLVAAADSYRRAIDADEGFVEAMVNLARVLVDQAELADAEAWLDRAEARQPLYPQIWAVRGLLALARGDSAYAVRVLSQARDAAPLDREVLTNLGAALIEQEHARAAIEVLSQASRLDPLNAEASMNLAIAHERNGDSQRALYHYERFLELAARNDSDRGVVHERMLALQQHTSETTLSPHVPASPLGATGSMTGAAAPSEDPWNDSH